MWSNKWKGTHWLSLRLILLKGTTDVHITSFYGEGFSGIVTSTPTIITAEKSPRGIDFFCRFWVSLLWTLNAVNFQSLSFSVRPLLCLMHIESLTESNGPASMTRAKCVGKSSAGLEPELVFPRSLKIMLQWRWKLFFLSREMGW